MSLRSPKSAMTSTVPPKGIDGRPDRGQPGPIDLAALDRADLTNDLHCELLSHSRSPWTSRRGYPIRTILRLVYPAPLAFAYGKRRSDWSSRLSDSASDAASGRCPDRLMHRHLDAL